MPRQTLMNSVVHDALSLCEVCHHMLTDRNVKGKYLADSNDDEYHGGFDSWDRVVRSGCPFVSALGMLCPPSCWGCLVMNT